MRIYLRAGAATVRLGVVPGLASCAVVPWLVHRVMQPEVRRTPEAPRFAIDELHKMGPLARDEWVTLAVFAGVSLLWMTSAWHRLDVTFVAMLGLAVLLITGTMPWQAAVTERAELATFTAGSHRAR